MSRWRKFLALPAGEKRLLLAAAMRLTAARLLLSMMGMGRTQRWIAAKRGADSPVCSPTQTGVSALRGRIDRASAERIARALTRIAPHLPVRTNCLDRAVALSWLLSSRGLAADLRIGVRKNENASLGAHAWVEHDRVVLLDDEAAHYLPIDAPMLASGGR